jgi:hypothetical protein
MRIDFDAANGAFLAVALARAVLAPGERCTDASDEDERGIGARNGRTVTSPARISPVAPLGSLPSSILCLPSRPFIVGLPLCLWLN